MYNRILVPVDGSTTALKGLAEALKLARALQARIKLIHVANEFIADPSFAPSVYYERVVESMRANGKEALANAQAMAKAHDTEVEVEMFETIGARAADCIVAAAKQWQADLIVMGTHGRRGLRRQAPPTLHSPRHPFHAMNGLRH